MREHLKRRHSRRHYKVNAGISGQRTIPDTLVPLSN